MLLSTWSKRLFIALVALPVLIHAIYPEDHWNYSKKLTADTFDDIVEEEINAGRTLFVRWIASPG